MTTQSDPQRLAWLNAPASSRNLAGLGWRNGLALGFGLALGVWGPAMLRWLQLPVAPIHWLTSLAGSVLVILCCTLFGWLTANRESTPLNLLLWTACSLLVNLIIGHAQYELRTWLTWQLQPLLNGLPLYPADDLQLPLLLSGFFVVLPFVLIGLLHRYRLTAIAGERTSNGRLNGRGIVLFWLPVVMLVIFGTIADSSHAQPTRFALRTTQAIVDRGRAYDGDLFTLTRESGISYLAIEHFRDKMGGDYQMALDTVYGSYIGVDVQLFFDNGLWLHCRVRATGDSNVYDRLDVCIEPLAFYAPGLDALLGGPPATCRTCTPDTDATTLAFLKARSLTPPLRLARLASAGPYAWLRITNVAGSAADCLLLLGRPPEPARLVRCVEGS